jgi:hypothetical protein
MKFFAPSIRTPAFKSNATLRKKHRRHNSNNNREIEAKMQTELVVIQHYIYIKTTQLSKGQIQARAHCKEQKSLV